MRAFKTLCCMIATCMAFAVCAQQNENVPPVRHSRIGDVAKSADGSITLKVVGQKLNYGGVKPELRDTDVWSPKSVHFHPNGKKYYINSLEGCRTMVYDARTNKKLAVIHHKFTPANAYLWAKESGFFPFTHYTNKKNLNTFWGRPVESTFSHRGRYLWIPYYRRSYDINAQDPSAISVIDTRTDSIIKVFETGPLPKMVATTHSGKYLAVTHWGDNTVGILDISSPNPDDWHYVKCVVVDYQLKLNLSMTTKVDRDCNSGYLLRGTVFTPDDHYMLIACMGGGGGIAVIDMQKIKAMNGKTAPISGWQTCKVGGGARTISLSPSGNFAFAACNSASQLCVADTRTMKQVATLTIDSYPVGLDISADGRFVVLTSQGRRGHGGNAVNLVEVTYKEKEPTSALIDEQKEEEDAAAAKVAQEQEQADAQSGIDWWYIGVAVGFVLGLMAVAFFRGRKK